VDGAWATQRGKRKETDTNAWRRSGPPAPAAPIGKKTGRSAVLFARQPRRDLRADALHDAHAVPGLGGSGQRAGRFDGDHLVYDDTTGKYEATARPGSRDGPLSVRGCPSTIKGASRFHSEMTFGHP
jgi:hypothetical protein